MKIQKRTRVKRPVKTKAVSPFRLNPYTLFLTAFLLYGVGILSVYQNNWEMSTVYILLGNVFTLLTVVLYDVMISRTG